MDIQTIWLIILSIATPVAGVVGFGIQLRNIKKLRLENQKLDLEVKKLQREFDSSDARIIKVTNDEVFKYSNNILFSKRACSTTESDIPSSTSSMFTGYSIGEIILIACLLFMLVYFLYDLYRFALWLLNLF